MTKIVILFTIFTLFLFPNGSFSSDFNKSNSNAIVLIGSGNKGQDDFQIRLETLGIEAEGAFLEDAKKGNLGDLNLSVVTDDSKVEKLLDATNVKIKKIEGERFAGKKRALLLWFTGSFISSSALLITSGLSSTSLAGTVALTSIYYFLVMQKSVYAAYNNWFGKRAEYLQKITKVKKNGFKYNFLELIPRSLGTFIFQSVAQSYAITVKNMGNIIESFGTYEEFFLKSLALSSSTTLALVGWDNVISRMMQDKSLKVKTEVVLWSRILTIASLWGVALTSGGVGELAAQGLKIYGAVGISAFLFYKNWISLTDLIARGYSGAQVQFSSVFEKPESFGKNYYISNNIKNFINKARLKLPVRSCRQILEY